MRRCSTVLIISWLVKLMHDVVYWTAPSNRSIHKTQGSIEREFSRNCQRNCRSPITRTSSSSSTNTIRQCMLRSRTTTPIWYGVSFSHLSNGAHLIPGQLVLCGGLWLTSQGLSEALVREGIMLSSTNLQSNPAVCACMMVGICRTAKSGWLSELNNVEVCDLSPLLLSDQLRTTQVFPMHAKDDRYAKFFLFTEEEVGLLCSANQSQVRHPKCRDCLRRSSDLLVNGLVSSLPLTHSDHAIIPTKQEVVPGL